MDTGLTSVTLGDARAEFASQFYPDDPTNPEFAKKLNEVIRRFITMEKWVGYRATYRVAVPEDRILVLPYYLESIQGAAFDKRPGIVQGDRYQFEYNGVGVVDENSHLAGVLMDLGSLATEKPFPSTASTLTFPAVAANSQGKVIRVMGLDENGKRVFDENGTPGEAVVLGAGSVVTTSTFSAVKGFQSEGVFENVEIRHTDADEVILNLEPHMTRPMFRAYQILDDAAEYILVLCKRRAVPVVNEEDYIFPGSLAALKLGMMAVRLEEAFEMGQSNQYFGKAIAILNEESSHFQGSAQESLDFAPWGPGISGIDNSM